MKAIPAIELPYFDTISGKYAVARSKPIPLTVEATRYVTAGHAEGRTTTAAGSALEAWSQGINANYEGPEVLVDQRAGPPTWIESPAWMALLICPPALYMIALAYVLVVRYHRSDPLAAKARVAYNECQKAMRRLHSSDASDADRQEQLLAVLRRYLGDRFRVPGGALTYADAEALLIDAGVKNETLDQLRPLFEQCEASQYAGGGKSAEIGTLITSAGHIVKAVERSARTPRQGRRAVGRASTLLLLALLLPVTAGAEVDPETLLDQANEQFSQANNEVAIDPAAAKELYERAALRFESIVTEHNIENGRLYYNIGNAYFRMEDIGRAILNYKRAEQYIPNDPDLQQNLAFARSKRMDKIEDAQRTRVLQTLFFWHYDFSTVTRSTLFAILFFATWSAALIRLSRRWQWLNWTIGLAGAIAVLLLGSLLIEASARASIRPGVIVSRSAVARKGVGESFAKSFTKPLHAGSEFIVIESRSKWHHVELPDGRRCWIPASKTELVR